MIAGRMSKSHHVAADFSRCNGVLGVLGDRGKSCRLAGRAANLSACFVDGRPWARVVYVGGRTHDDRLAKDTSPSVGNCPIVF
jgi:hypothetical protein